MTEHRTHAKCCGHCGTVTRAVFPGGVSAPVQYGPRIAGVAVYLQHAPLPAGGSAVAGDGRALRRAGDGCNAGDHEREGGRAAAGRGLAHTGPGGGHGAGETHGRDRVPDRRADAVASCDLHAAAGGVPGSAAGAAPCSRVSPASSCTITGKPYFAMEGVKHSLCNAHHLRELQALVDIEGEAWAGRMQRLLRRANRAARIAQDKDIAVPARLVAPIERRYDEIIAEALAFHESQPPFSPGKRKKRRKRRIGHNLALRLRDHKCAVLPVPDRPRGRVHKQRGRARPSDDEAAPEDLRGLPIREGGRELRHPAQRDHHRQEAGLEHHRSPDQPIGSAHRHGQVRVSLLRLGLSKAGVIPMNNLGSYH